MKKEGKNKSVTLRSLAGFQKQKKKNLTGESYKWLRVYTARTDATVWRWRKRDGEDEMIVCRSTLELQLARNELSQQRGHTQTHVSNISPITLPVWGLNQQPSGHKLCSLTFRPPLFQQLSVEFEWKMFSPFLFELLVINLAYWVSFFLKKK